MLEAWEAVRLTGADAGCSWCAHVPLENESWPLSLIDWLTSRSLPKTNHFGHTGYINTLSLAPAPPKSLDEHFAAPRPRGKDGIAMLWDLRAEPK
jgi:hypothetical protein